MPKYLNTFGKTTLAIGICGRCSRKFSLDDLVSDPNSPGLKVCRADRDDYDPYRLQPRAADRIALRYARPDTDIGTHPAGWIGETNELFVITEDTDEYVVFFAKDEAA